MGLPTEIRLIILRELLVVEQPLAKRRTYEPPRAKWYYTTAWNCAEEQDFVENLQFLLGETVVSGYGLTPAVLGVCQELLYQGWPLLYGENTLEVDMFPGDCPTTVAGTGISAMYRIGNALVCGERAVDGSNVVSTGPRGGLQLHENAMKLLFKFKKLEVRLNVGHTHYIGCRYWPFRDLLTHIAPALVGCSVAFMFLNSEMLQLAMLQRWIDALQILRCDQFQLHGVRDDALNKSHRRRVIEVVTSQDEIVDLSLPLRNLNSLVHRFESPPIAALYSSWALPTLQNLTNAAMRFDVEEFNNLRSECIATLDRAYLSIKQDILKAS